MQLFLQSTKSPKLRYRVLKYDPVTKQGVLKGSLGTEFTRDISKAALEKWGYTLVKVEDHDPSVDNAASSQA